MELRDETVKLANGLVRQRIDDGTIAIYTFYNNRRETLDVWYETLRLLNAQWDTHRPYLILYDASRVFLTPYFRKRANDLNSLERTDLHGAIAVLMPDSLAGHLMQVFIKRDLKKAPHTFYAEVFHEYAEALEWLRAMRTQFATTN